MQEEADVAENDEADDMPEIQETVAVIPGSTLLWRVCPRPPHSAEVHTHTPHRTFESITPPKSSH